MRNGHGSKRPIQLVGDGTFGSVPAGHSGTFSKEISSRA